MNQQYGYGKTVQRGFDEAVSDVVDALQREGFGVPGDIDVAATLNKKIGAEMPPYRILGACNPPLAQRAIEAEPSIGLLLPCNVVVRRDRSGTVHVEVMNTEAVLQLVDKPGLPALAKEVRERLDRVLAAL
jgi:uncharacterized protein (DUF302 family)